MTSVSRLVVSARVENDLAVAAVEALLTSLAFMVASLVAARAQLLLQRRERGRGAAEAFENVPIG